MSEPIRKRFIAGAVCPACQAQDTLKMWTQDGTPHRERGNSVPKELPTRVNISALKPKKPDPTVQAVQFFPNPKLKKPD